ncbi:phosphoribosylglycinamide formyltransferase [Agrilactobacillus yilanensis]|uniref:Phosphoribosylglycinamide formyltransferase n=1 Tax=Agrilactobacillus yilanensis TaxID=2485997 RepID=A0ABW4J729_9LACO|nr:phosphoribosylglycinamide formyltransferase [Agrilactobacillus yilanensis]
MKKIAIFASGTGTNFVALTKAIQQQHLPVTVSLLVCDHEDAQVLQRAAELKVPIFVINFKAYPNKAAAEQAILDQLAKAEVTAILLAGYMRIIGPTLLGAYTNKILNIHPALLPNFPGAHGIEDAFKAGVKTTGVTVHYIDAAVDSGPIIAQKAVPILAEDTLATLEARIHETEHQLYPAVLADLIKKGDL